MEKKDYSTNIFTSIKLSGHSILTEDLGEIVNNSVSVRH